jgi:hypothetical protein
MIENTSPAMITGLIIGRHRNPNGCFLLSSIGVL